MLPISLAAGRSLIGRGDFGGRPQALFYFTDIEHYCFFISLSLFLKMAGFVAAINAGRPQAPFSCLMQRNASNGPSSRRGYIQHALTPRPTLAVQAPPPTHDIFDARQTTLALFHASASVRDYHFDATPIFRRPFRFQVYTIIAMPPMPLRL